MLVDSVRGPAAQHMQEGLYRSPLCFKATCLLQLDSLSHDLHCTLLIAHATPRINNLSHWINFPYCSVESGMNFDLM